MSSSTQADEPGTSSDPKRPGPFLATSHLTSPWVATWISPVVLGLVFLFATNGSVLVACLTVGFVLALLGARLFIWARSWVRCINAEMARARKRNDDVTQTTWDEIHMQRVEIVELRASVDELRSQADERWKDTKKISTEQAAARAAHLMSNPAPGSYAEHVKKVADSAEQTTFLPDVSGTVLGRRLAEIVAEGRPGARRRPGGSRPGDSE